MAGVSEPASKRLALASDGLALGWAVEHEDLNRDVGPQLARADAHPSTRYLLDPRHEILTNRLLERTAGAEHQLAHAVPHEALLALGQRVREDDRDHLAVEVGASL